MDGDAFQTVPVDRRKFVKTVLAASAVTVPVVTSISLGGAAPAFASGDTPNLSGLPSRGQGQGNAGTSGNPAEPGGTTTTTTPTDPATPTDPVNPTDPRILESN